jgi:hypothetical protein
MPKIIFEKSEKNLIPEGVSAKENEDGTFEVDAIGVLNKNKQLLTKNATLQTKVEEAESAKEAADAQAAEWKGKAKIPAGKALVDADVAELGEAAKSANLSKDEIPTLKTDVETLKTEKAKSSRNEVRAKAAAAAGLSPDKFTRLAETEDFDVEFVKEGDKETAFAVTKDAEGKATKTAFPEFVEKHDRFSLVLDSLKATEADKKKTTPFPSKETPVPGNVFDKIREQVKTETKTEKVDLGARFGRPESV